MGGVGPAGFDCEWCGKFFPPPVRYQNNGRMLCGVRCDMKFTLSEEGGATVTEIEILVDAMSDEEVAIWEELA